MAPRSYFISPENEPHLTTPDEDREVIRDLKVSKFPGPNGIPKRGLKHIPKRAVSLPSSICNAVLRTHTFPQTWEQARVISILKPGKDPALPSFYRPFSTLDTIDKLFEGILLARILQVVVVSHRPSQEVDSSKDGYAGPLLQRKSDLFDRKAVLL